MLYYTSIYQNRNFEKENKQGVNMDKLDYRILNILKENGRETASDISKAIHLSVSAVLDRIKKMEEAGS